MYVKMTATELARKGENWTCEEGEITLSSMGEQELEDMMQELIQETASVLEMRRKAADVTTSQEGACEESSS